jgi:hypothetical protein
VLESFISLKALQNLCCSGERLAERGEGEEGRRKRKEEEEGRGRGGRREVREEGERRETNQWHQQTV